MGPTLFVLTSVTEQEGLILATGLMFNQDALQYYWLHLLNARGFAGMWFGTSSLILQFLSLVWRNTRYYYGPIKTLMKLLSSTLQKSCANKYSIQVLSQGPWESVLCWNLLYDFLGMWLRANCPTSLYPSFPISKMRMIVVPPSKSVVKIN